MGELPPWEMAKAFAFQTILADVAENLATTPAELVGGRVDEYIAGKVTVRGGGHPTPRCVRQVLARCQDPSWYPGKASRGNGGGRPPIYSERQKQEVARVARPMLP